jgi:2-phosphosulfolactate phosphatase
MMIDVVMLPTLLNTESLIGSQVVVFDVLRASSVIVTALSNGAKEIRLFGTVEETLAGKPLIEESVLLGGERNCLKLPDFDLGNSPSEYSPDLVNNRTICFTTTNGTAAVIAAMKAKELYIGSILNARSTAQALLPQLKTSNTILLCAGTNGLISIEDLIGAGAVLWHMMEEIELSNLSITDTAWISYQTFNSIYKDLPNALRLGRGAANLIKAKLEKDIDDCAKLNSKSIVAKIHKDPLRVLVE